MGKIIDRVRQRQASATLRSVQAAYPNTQGLRAREASCRERSLNQMTDRIMQSRASHPHQTVHCVALKTPRATVQITVGRWIPASGVRDFLAGQMAAINAREGF